ncbi:MAG: hypothetical protein AAF222_12085 [Pseudomonadota bacterium]
MGSDWAELQNIKLANRVPQSSPTQLVDTFDTFCIPASAQGPATDAELRRAHYVPLPAKNGHVKVYLADDRRPAIVISATICSVHVRSRAGQSAHFKTYMRTTFPAATPINPKGVGSNAEHVWQVNHSAPAFIITERGITVDGFQSFTVSIYRQV